MPTLDWIGKKAVVNHHREVPYRLIHCDRDKSVGDPDAGNLLVQGDNLEALKALLPYYAGKVKCIYIDPPYNTGNESWVYNDNVNSPEIKAWLGSVVGKEAEDLSRHDKWLCMMYPRLRLLKEFLSENAAIICSINDVEFPRMRMLLEEIFGANNALATFVWVNEGNIDNQSKIKVNHEYVLAFAKREGNFRPGAAIDPNISADSKLLRDKISNTVVKNGPKNPISEILLPAGFPANFEQGIIQPNTSPSFWPKFSSPIVVENWQVVEAVGIQSGWSSKNILEQFIAARFADIVDRKSQQTRFFMTRSGAVFIEKDRSEDQSHVLSTLVGLGTVQEASSMLERMGVEFPYPKPARLVKYLIKALCDSDDALVMDSFAGSGTTGEAVMELNREDNGSRRFLLVEMDSQIARDKTSKRLALNVSGYTYGKTAKRVSVDGLGGGFRFCTLGEPLFDADGNVNPSVTFPDLAAHVFFCETGSPIPKRADGSTALLGTFQGRAIYLLHSAGAIGVASPNAGNVLTGSILDRLALPEPGFVGARIVYAEGCTVPDERLNRLGVTFKQIPYQIEGL